MPKVELPGCRIEPMMGYLKAIGVFRLVNQQADPSCKAFFEGDCFCLDSTLSASDLVLFFAERYSPTPIVTPWNGGAGFDGRLTPEIKFILDRKEERFRGYQETIREIFGWPEIPAQGRPIQELATILMKSAEEARGDAAKSKKLMPLRKIQEKLQELTSESAVEIWQMSLEEIERQYAGQPGMPLQEMRKLRTAANKLIRETNKNYLVSLCRNRLNDRAVEWIDAAVAIGGDRRLAHMPLLGTGGNEGRLDYGKNFMSALRNALPAGEESISLLQNSLFAMPTNAMVVAPSGKHNPGRAGGFNQGAEIETKDFPTNPWDFILSMEGNIAWSGSVSRRHSASLTHLQEKPRVRGRITSPFTVTSKPVGYGSESSRDQAVAEIWAPVWGAPTGYPEFQYFLSEGRAEIGGRPVRNTLEFAEAVASLGVDRGVKDFVRHAILKRRCESYVTVPVGILPVEFRRESDLARQLHTPLEELDAFIRRFPRESIPQQLESGRLQIDRALYSVLSQGGSSRVKALVAAIGRIEKQLAIRDLAKKPALRRPLGGLPTSWIAAMDDGTLEVRIACALASISATGKVGPIRSNLEQVDPRQPWKWGTSSRQMRWIGGSFCRRLSGVLRQRLMDADRLNCDRNPTFGSLRLNPCDVAGFIEGAADDDLIEDLLFGLMWVNWESNRNELQIVMDRWKEPVRWYPLKRQWILLKLLVLPGPLQLSAQQNAITIKSEPSLIPLLEAGRIGEACLLARRRLFAQGLNPYKVIYPSTGNDERIAASLLIPISNIRSIAHDVIALSSQS